MKPFQIAKMDRLIGTALEQPGSLLSRSPKDPLFSGSFVRVARHSVGVRKNLIHDAAPAGGTDYALTASSADKFCRPSICSSVWLLLGRNRPRRRGAGALGKVPGRPQKLSAGSKTATDGPSQCSGQIFVFGSSIVASTYCRVFIVKPRAARTHSIRSKFAE